MRRHAGECLPCARHDRTVRKGCALVDELPIVRTADDFTVRLRDRIARDRSRRRRLATTGSLIVPAAGVVAILAVIAAGPLLRTEPAPIELDPVQARAPVSFAPALGAGAHLGGARLYRAATTLPGVWLGDGGVPHRHEAVLIYQGARRDPGYPTLFLEPPAFPAEPALLESRLLPVDLR